MLLFYFLYSYYIANPHKKERKDEKEKKKSGGVTIPHITNIDPFNSSQVSLATLQESVDLSNVSLAFFSFFLIQV